MNLIDLIKEDLIFVDLKVKDKFDLIKILYEKLYQKGYVKESYLKGVTDREKVYPTGINLETSYSVAIPHTEAEYVLKPAICIAILKEPIKFKRMDSPEEDIDVNAVFMIALNDKEKQAIVLEKLIEAFTNKDLMEKLLKEKDKSNIVNLFK
ncbi:PTS sugar transporter subunit IIA [Clostridium sp. cel8]|jgi:galactitol PTS system EIIA component|uniref:PTS sugar transporter subunit IIA n=1 Tax=unclassified Clostridium TaxID=2614128 RepID=UPI0015F68872|nr:PTS sugar transporter subunit IIA [Clostridium sp. cel8]MBA5850690.1 PTS sugar transporter subunit IIA [Clostridium sp. cel8]